MSDVEYRHVTVQAGQFAQVCNDNAVHGFVVNSVIKDGNHFYILFEKWDYPEEAQGAAEEE